MAQINGQDIQKMVRHWLDTPINGYLGSDYGQDTKSLLQKPFASGVADSYLSKLKDDVAVLKVIKNSANLYASQRKADKLDIVIEVLGQPVSIKE